MHALFRHFLLAFGIFWGSHSLLPAQVLSIGLEGGMGVQTIEETQAVLSSGWQAAFLPQASMRLHFRKWEVVGLRAGLGFMRKGARVPVTSVDYPDAPAGTGFLIVEGSYAHLSLGASAGAEPNAHFRLEGFLDLVGGYFLQGNYRNHLYPAGHPQRNTRARNLFNTSYIGIHLGGSLGWLPAPGWRIYLQPTLEAQLNNAFRSTVFVPRFLGFSPLLGFSYDIQ